MSLTLDGSAGVTTNSGAVYNGIASGTAVASTSGTSIDFTGIPSWVKRITVMFNEVSLSGTSNILIQLGTGSTTYTTSGYVATSNDFNQANATGGASSTSGFPVFISLAAGVFSGHMMLTLISGNTWISSHTGKFSTTTVTMGGGSIALGASFTAVRITTVNGTDTFDAGSINILYE